MRRTRAQRATALAWEVIGGIAFVAIMLYIDVHSRITEAVDMALRIGSRVRLLASRYFPDAVVPVVDIRRGSHGEIVSVDVDCGREDGSPYAYPVHEVEEVSCTASATE